MPRNASDSCGRIPETASPIAPPSSANAGSSSDMNVSATGAIAVMISPNASENSPPISDTDWPIDSNDGARASNACPSPSMSALPTLSMTGRMLWNVDPSDDMMLCTTGIAAVMPVPIASPSQAMPSPRRSTIPVRLPPSPVNEETKLLNASPSGARASPIELKASVMYGATVFHSSLRVSMRPDQMARPLSVFVKNNVSAAPSATNAAMAI